MTVRVLTGDAVDVLKTLPAHSVHSCCCSPPFFGLRDYGTAQWEGGAADCDHRPQVAPFAARPRGALTGGLGYNDARDAGAAAYKAMCGRCGARRADKQIGMEATPAEFVARLVAVFEEAKRVLRQDGTLWIEIGDSYAGGGGYYPDAPSNRAGSMQAASQRSGLRNVKGRVLSGIPAKSLLGIPWRLAFALQDAGWILRQEIIWEKKSCTPECLAPDTHVYVRDDAVVRRVTLDALLAAGEPYPAILTPTGWRAIHHVWEVERDGAVMFDAAKVSTVVCSAEHRWPVSHDRRRSATHLLPTSALRASGYNDYLLHCTPEPWLCVDDPDAQIDGQALDYDLGWLLGLYAAEGGFPYPRGHRCKVTLHREETDLQARVSALAQARFGAAVQAHTIANYTEIHFASRTWHELAGRVVRGTCTTKDLDLDVILNAPHAFRRGIWDGYIDGDGTARPRGVSASSASRALRDAMAVVASSVGLLTSKATRMQRDARTGQTYVSYQLWTPYVTRRQKKDSDTHQIPIRNRRDLPGPHRLIDIEVDGGVFLIDDGLVTHNSVQDRCTRSHSTIFMFAQQSRYYYDATAIREPNSSPEQLEHNLKYAKSYAAYDDRAAVGGQPGNVNSIGIHSRPGGVGRNRRSVWSVPSAPYSSGRDDIDHFACWPPALVEPMVLASTSARGCCPACGAPWKRVVERGELVERRARPGKLSHLSPQGYIRAGGSRCGVNVTVETRSWQPTCRCGHEETVPCTVLDCFSGSGTTLQVATKHGRDAIGVDLNPQYVPLMDDRLDSVQLSMASLL